MPPWSTIRSRHKGDPALFFDLGTTETVCKQDHDTLIQREEARGYTIGADADGRPEPSVE